MEQLGIDSVPASMALSIGELIQDRTTYISASRSTQPLPGLSALVARRNNRDLRAGKRVDLGSMRHFQSALLSPPTIQTRILGHERPSDVLDKLVRFGALAPRQHDAIPILSAAPTHLTRNPAAAHLVDQRRPCYA